MMDYRPLAQIPLFYCSVSSDTKQRRKSTRNHSKFHTSQTGKLQLVQQPLQHTSYVHVGLQPNPLLSFHCAPHSFIGLCLDSHLSSNLDNTCIVRRLQRKKNLLS